MSFNSRTEIYRQRCREKVSLEKYNGYLHVSFLSLFCLSIITWSIIKLNQPTWQEYLVFPITFIYANLAEYLGHKGPMHHKRKGFYGVFKSHTIVHHQFFTDKKMDCDEVLDFKMILFSPVLLIFFFVCFAVPATFIMYWLWSANAAYILLATLFLYYLNYEWLHLIYHLPEKYWITRLPFIKSLRRIHLGHHNPQWMQKYNFNISYPIFDWIFKTLKF